MPRNRRTLESIDYQISRIADHVETLATPPEPAVAVENHFHAPPAERRLFGEAIAEAAIDTAFVEVVPVVARPARIAILATALRLKEVADGRPLSRMTGADLKALEADYVEVQSLRDLLGITSSDELHEAEELNARLAG